jgi:hypothetical protein
MPVELVPFTWNLVLHTSSLTLSMSAYLKCVQLFRSGDFVCMWRLPLFWFFKWYDLDLQDFCLRIWFFSVGCFEAHLIVWGLWMIVILNSGLHYRPWVLENVLGWFLPWFSEDVKLNVQCSIVGLRTSLNYFEPAFISDESQIFECTCFTLLFVRGLLE